MWTYSWSLLESNGLQYGGPSLMHVCARGGKRCIHDEKCIYGIKMWRQAERPAQPAQSVITPRLNLGMRHCLRKRHGGRMGRFLFYCPESHPWQCK